MHQEMRVGSMGLVHCTSLADRVKTPCRNDNEHHSNPAIACCDTTLRADSRQGIYLARHGRAFEFSHGLLELCKEDGRVESDGDPVGRRRPFAQPPRR